MKTKTMLTILVIILFLITSYFIYNMVNKDLSYINININPEIQLAVNDKDIVEEVIGLNEDADILISDLEIVGLNTLEAIDILVDASIETGYIDEFSDENDVVVTVMEDNETDKDNDADEDSQDLATKVVDRVNKRLADKNIYAVVLLSGVTEKTKELALQYDVSNGKMMLVERAVMLNPELTMEELVVMSVKAIQTEIKTQVTRRREELKLSKEEYKEKRIQEKKELKEQQKNKIQSHKEELLEEANIDSDDINSKELLPLIKNEKNKIKEKVENYKKAALEETNKKTNSKVKDIIKNTRNKIKAGQ